MDISKIKEMRATSKDLLDLVEQVWEIDNHLYALDENPSPVRANIKIIDNEVSKYIDDEMIEEFLERMLLQKRIVLVDRIENLTDYIDGLDIRRNL